MARNKRFVSVNGKVKTAIARAHKACGNYTRFGGKAPKAPRDWQAPIDEVPQFALQIGVSKGDETNVDSVVDTKTSNLFSTSE
jgi:hypothetical protein